MEAQKYDQLSEQAQVVLEQDSLGAEAKAAGHKRKGEKEGMKGLYRVRKDGTSGSAVCTQEKVVEKTFR